MSACSRPCGKQASSPSGSRARLSSTQGPLRQPQAARSEASAPRRQDACVRNRCVYFAAVGGIAALLAKHVTKSETVAWDDLGTEALRRIELIDFPVFVAVDSQGGDLYRAIESGEQL